jgi:hypothetical protein
VPALPTLPLFINLSGFEDGPTEERQFVIGERRQVEQRRVLVAALDLRGREPGVNERCGGFAISSRRSVGAVSSRITESMYSSGTRPDALTLSINSRVFLFGVPFWRPPRRSPSCDPRGICYSLLLVRPWILTTA